MQDFLPFIVIGLATGAVYGLAGVGLVLAYKTSGIFNFAYGAVAALTVFVFYWLHDEHGWPWGLAAAVCVLVIGPAEGCCMELLGRALEQVGATLKVVATVGLLLIVLGVGELWYGNNEVNFPPFLPTFDGPDPRRERRLGSDHRHDHLGHCDRGPLLLLPLRPDGIRHARRRRQPRSPVDDRREPDTGAALGLDHQHDVLLHGGTAARPRAEPERRDHLDPRRLRVRRSGDRLLLQAFR